MKHDEIDVDALMGFYDAGEESLSDEEREQLTPILNSLKDFDERVIR